MWFPVLAGVVEAIPDFDLHEDAPLMSPLEHIREPLPVFVVPLLQVVFAVGDSLIRIQFKALILAVTHRVADVVRPHLGHLVQMFFQVGQLKQAVILAASQ